MTMEPCNRVVACLVTFGTVFTAWCVHVFFARQRKHSRWLKDELDRIQGMLYHERHERKAERQGRIRAEMEMKRLKYQQAASLPAARPATQDGASHPMSSHQTGKAVGVPLQGQISYPVRPIGTIQSCFSQRNGTPRQPLLVPLARSRLRLVSDIPPLALEGLELYSHVWVLYIFHENTDLTKLWQGDRSGIKAKVSVPRLNGGKMGVLATRSPHRPVPIGLSVAQVIAVEGNCLTLGGADIVDGSPVLDIKPYLPFCDWVTSATAPLWVKGEAEDEPLRVSQVVCPEAASAMVSRCWEEQRERDCGLDSGRNDGSLYASSKDFLELVKQVLSRDIRPVHRRIPSPQWADAPASPACFYPGTDHQIGAYHVVLEKTDISYDIDGEGGVLLRGACPNTVQSQQRGLGLLE